MTAGSHQAASQVTPFARRVVRVASIIVGQGFDREFTASNIDMLAVIDPTLRSDRRRHHLGNLVIAMTNPFDVPKNHRLLAAESALTILYGATGLMGVTAKIRDDAVNRYLVGQGK